MCTIGAGDGAPAHAGLHAWRFLGRGQQDNASGPPALDGNGMECRECGIPARPGHAGASRGGRLPLRTQVGRCAASGQMYHFDTNRLVVGGESLAALVSVARHHSRQRGLGATVGPHPKLRQW
jgi:hypothetical protein